MPDFPISISSLEPLDFPRLLVALEHDVPADDDDQQQGNVEVFARNSQIPA